MSFQNSATPPALHHLFPWIPITWPAPPPDSPAFHQSVSHSIYIPAHFLCSVPDCLVCIPSFPALFLVSLLCLIPVLNCLLDSLFACSLLNLFALVDCLPGFDPRSFIESKLLKCRAVGFSFAILRKLTLSLQTLSPALQFPDLFVWAVAQSLPLSLLAVSTSPHLTHHCPLAVHLGTRHNLLLQH